MIIISRSVSCDSAGSVGDGGASGLPFSGTRVVEALANALNSRDSLDKEAPGICTTSRTFKIFWKILT